ncbi:MAG: VCBS repeat-containing protein [Desulfobacteraceae bacterium]|jgi:TolB-like protein
MDSTALKFQKTAALVFLVVLFLALPAALAAEKTVGLLPFVLHTDPSKAFLREGIQSMLVSRLEGEGLSVLHGEGITPLLTEHEQKGIDSEERAREIARELDVDYVIFGSITTLGGGYSLDFSILDLSGEKPERTQVAEAVDENQLISRLSDMAHQFRAVVEGVDFQSYQAARRGGMLPDEKTAKGLFFRPGAAGYGFQPTGRASVRMGVMSFDTGNLNADGNLELLFLTRENLLVYHREKNHFILQDTLEAGMGEYFYKVSVADADLDGKDEIYLVMDYGDRALSIVYDWDGTFRERFRMRGHLHADSSRDGRPPVVYFQDTMLDRYFKGDVFVMDFKGRDKLVPERALPEFEKGIQFYTLTQCDLDGDGGLEFLGLSDLAYLHVWNLAGKSLWTSNDKMGGTNNAIKRGVKQTDRLAKRIPFNSQPEVMDINGDGIREVLAIKNIPIFDHLTNLKLYYESKLYAYKVEGNQLSSEWATGELKYSIADVKAAGETLYIAFLEGKWSKLSAARGRIMWFE